jgi:hypothetical protein
MRWKTLRSMALPPENILFSSDVKEEPDAQAAHC